MIEWWGQHLDMITDIRLITRERVDELLQKHRSGVSVQAAAPANSTANCYQALLTGMLNAACKLSQGVVSLTNQRNRRPAARAKRPTRGVRKNVSEKFQRDQPPDGLIDSEILIYTVTFWAAASRE
jgi:hypothetical protein